MGHAQNVKQRDPRQLHLSDGRILGYALYGDPAGRPLLAIHGSPGSHIMMKPADHFARQNGIFLIAPDRPGYGRSDAAPEMSFAQWVADIEALLSHLKIERFWLFGVSGGGPFATAIASLMAQRVIGMALVSPVGLFDPEIRDNWSWRHRLLFGLLPRYRFIATRLLLVARGLLRTSVPLFMKLFSIGLTAPDRLILKQGPHQQSLSAAFLDGSRKSTQGLADDLHLFASSWHLPLQNVDMPVMVWQGTMDKMVPEQAALKLARRFDDVEIVTLPEQGHFWILEHFEDVLEKLMVLGDSQAFD